MTAAMLRVERVTPVTDAARPASLAMLRQRLASVTEAPHAEVRALATGVAVLDAALTRGGIPCGRLTELLGARGAGKTTLLRHLVRATIARGLWVAYVDAARTLAPRDWAAAARAEPARAHGGGGGSPALWMVRPPRGEPHSRPRAAWCAELLLRSGAFALVVLDGAPPLTSAVAVRLARLARDGGSAFVVAADDDAAAAALGGALRLRVARSKRVDRITVEKGGRRTTVEVEHERTLAHRVCAHPEVPDRRGVARARAADERGGESAAAVRAGVVAAGAAPVRHARKRTPHVPAAVG
jgi:energy-coupling factor transporter ATP-binding protein EcfA2